MTEQEFTEFMLACCLSNEEIGQLWGVTANVVRLWRTGKMVPADGPVIREFMVRITSMEENRVLRAMIDKQEEKRK